MPGVPNLSRKIITSTKPLLEINVDKSQHWNITISSLVRVTAKFKLGEEYEEYMPGGIVLKVVISYTKITSKMMLVIILYYMNFRVLPY